MEKNIILASGSPRRKKLLEMCGLSFDIITGNPDESKIEDGIKKKYSDKNSYYIAEKIVECLSREKALGIKESVADKYGQNFVIIGSDTMVVGEEQIFGKPRNKKEAYKMLRSLCGRVHRVYTGLSLVYANRVESYVSYTDVLFYDYDHKMEEIICKYIESGSPMDKAGAYGIQDMGALLVKEIRGDYYTVMGLPISKLMRILL